MVLKDFNLKYNTDPNSYRAKYVHTLDIVETAIACHGAHNCALEE